MSFGPVLYTGAPSLAHSQRLEGNHILEPGTELFWSRQLPCTLMELWRVGPSYAILWKQPFLRLLAFPQPDPHIAKFQILVNCFSSGSLSNSFCSLCIDTAVLPIIVLCCLVQGQLIRAYRLHNIIACPASDTCFVRL